MDLEIFILTYKGSSMPVGVYDSLEKAEAELLLDVEEQDTDRSKYVIWSGVLNQPANDGFTDIVSTVNK